MRPSWKYAQHLAPTVVPQSNYESPKKHINIINCNLKLIVLLLSLDHPKGFGSQNFGPKNQWQTKSVSPQYLHIFSSSHLLPGQAHTCTRPDGRGVQVRIRVKFECESQSECESSANSLKTFQLLLGLPGQKSFEVGSQPKKPQTVEHIHGPPDLGETWATFALVSTYWHRKNI